jgi:hypothetical protein
MEDVGRDVRRGLERDHLAGADLAARDGVAAAVEDAQPAQELVERVVLLEDDHDVLDRVRRRRERQSGSGRRQDE